MKKKLYRWYNDLNIKTLFKYFKKPKEWLSNFYNVYDEAYTFWYIVWEYLPISDLILKEMNISKRKDSIYDYDNEILISKYDWYIWDVWDWLSHVRVKNKKIKLEKIHINHKDIKENIWILIKLNRNYLWDSQKQFSKKFKTSKPRLSSYENGKVMPRMDRFIEYIKFLPIPQEIDRNWKKIVFN